MPLEKQGERPAELRPGGCSKAGVTADRSAWGGHAARLLFGSALGPNPLFLPAPPPLFFLSEWQEAQKYKLACQEMALNIVLGGQEGLLRRETAVCRHWRPPCGGKGVLGSASLSPRRSAGGAETELGRRCTPRLLPRYAAQTAGTGLAAFRFRISE